MLQHGDPLHHSIVNHAIFGWVLRSQIPRKRLAACRLIAEASSAFIRFSYSATQPNYWARLIMRYLGVSPKWLFGDRHSPADAFSLNAEIASVKESSSGFHVRGLKTWGFREVRDAYDSGTSSSNIYRSTTDGFSVHEDDYAHIIGRRRVHHGD